MSSSSSSSKASKFPFSSSSPGVGSSAHSSRFTAEMQDRQARNKDPTTGLAYQRSHDGEERVLATTAGAAVGAGPSHSSKNANRIAYAEDAYESLERRRWAAAILDSPELLIMHALSRGDSVAGVKHHFTKVLCGYDDPPRYRDRKAAAGKEKEKPTAVMNYKPFTGAFEI